MRLGMLNVRRGEPVAAHDNFTQALMLDARYPEAGSKLAAMYHREEQYVECMRTARRTLNHCPSHYGAYAGLGMSLEKSGMQR
jgi:Tfp pilus assembly protein PilF